MKSAGTLIMCAALLLVISAAAQNPAGDAKHFAKDGLSFDYPAGWTIEDQSSSEIQSLTLSRDGYAQIFVRSPRALVDSPAKEADARRIIQDGWVNAWAKRFTDEGAKAERAEVSTEIAGAPAAGSRLNATLDNEPGRVDVYWRLIEKRMVQLTIVGSIKDITLTAAAWDIVRHGVKIEPPAQPSPTPGKPSP